MNTTTNYNNITNSNNNNSLKRKRDIDIDIIECAMRSNRIKEINDNVDDLILEFDTSNVLTPEDEYILLLESNDYEYDEKTINQIIIKADIRYKRYIKCVNFHNEGYPIVKDYIDRFFIIKNKASKKEILKLIQKIDNTLLDVIDEVNCAKRQKY